MKDIESLSKCRSLIFADNWTEWNFQLRKEVIYNLMPPSGEDAAYNLNKVLENTTVVTVNPTQSIFYKPAIFANFAGGKSIKDCNSRGVLTHHDIKNIVGSKCPAIKFSSLPEDLLY